MMIVVKSLCTSATLFNVFIDQILYRYICATFTIGAGRGCLTKF